MKKNLNKACSLILVLAMIISLIPAAVAAGHPFKDVPAGSWFDVPVKFCYDNNLMTGTSSTTFEPNIAMSRAMLVTVLHRMEGSPEPAVQTPFTDVASGTWFTKAAAWAYSSGVVIGTSATKFSPNVNISREQLVTIFYRYAKSEGHDVSKVTNLSSYSDSSKVSNYATEAFGWAVANGIIQGTTPTQLSPAGFATRAQCATIIQRFVKWAEANSSAEPPHSHEFKSSEIITPTCEAEGYTIYTCSCGETTRQNISALGHSWGEWITTKEPTNSEDGTQTRTCATCGATENMIVPYAPADHEHTFGAWTVIYPTCISEGYEYRTCECGYIQNGATFPIKDHSWGEWATTKEPTTTEIGSAKRICSVCGTEEDKELPKHVHSYGDWIKVDSTCTEDGYYYQTCECGYSETVETIAKKNHTYEMVAAVDATCISMGSETYECAACKDTYIKDLDMIAHDWTHNHTDEVGHWSDYLLVCTCGWSCSKKNAINSGFMTVGEYWSRKHESYYSTIGADNDHSYDTKGIDWVIDTPAADIWTCSGCGASTTNHGELTGHNLISAKGYPTCFDGGEEIFICSVCDYSYRTIFQNSLGHTWGEWTIVEEPSENSRGWATRTCAFEYYGGMICGFTMGDYADLVIEGQHYHSYKPESQTVCIECGEDSIPG